MKYILLGLLSVVGLAGEAIAFERVLKQPENIKALSDWDQLADLAMKGVGQQREMDREDCAIEIGYSRHKYIKEMWEDEASSVRGKHKLGYKYQTIRPREIPCRVKQ